MPDQTTDAAFASFEDEVRATRPEADAAFMARLDRDVAAGFATPPRAARPRRSRLWTFGPLGAAALAATALAVAIVPGGDSTAPPDGAVAEDARQQAAPSAGGVATSPKAAAEADTLAGPSSAQTNVLPANPAPGSASSESKTERQVERSASLTIAAKDGDVQAATDRIVQTTARLGGYVAQSNVSVRGRAGSASLTLRVPTGRLDEAMAALARVGSVRAIDQQQSDITSQFDAAAAELQEAKAERIGLLSALRRAEDDAQIQRLRQRLRESTARIKAADGALSQVRARATRATIEVQVTGRATKVEPDTREQGFGLGRAAEIAVSVLAASAGVLLVLVAAAIPLAAVTGIGLLASRAVRRRRREQALGHEDR
ncbi:MAG: DUF4349 domain-containing protein [Baekduia sp.]